MLFTGQKEGETKRQNILMHFFPFDVTNLCESDGPGSLRAASYNFVTMLHYNIITCLLNSSIGIATGYGAERPRCSSFSSGGGKIFHTSTSFKSVLGPTEPPMQ
jgi:hypothetical protein